MLNLHHGDIDGLWSEALELLLVYNHGEMKTPRGLSSLGVGPVAMTLENPRRRILENPIRLAKKHFMAGEFTWIVSGLDDLEMISFYNSQMKKFSDDGKRLWGAYGPRFRNQLDLVLLKLKQDKDTRQAVLTLWTWNPPETKDVPCTISFQFRRNKGKLDMITYMRSNDLWLGFPYDVFTFTLIQEVVAFESGIPLGQYHHVVGDLHLYEKNIEEAKVAWKVKQQSYQMPQLRTPLYKLEKELKAADICARTPVLAEVSPRDFTLADDGCVAWLQEQMIARGTCK